MAREETTRQEEVGMNPEQQTLPYQIRNIVNEALAPLQEDIAQLEQEHHDQHFELQKLDQRMASMAEHLEQIEKLARRIISQIDTLDTRTSSVYTDRLNFYARLSELEDNINRNLGLVKSDLRGCVTNLHELRDSQTTHDRKLSTLEGKMETIQSRMFGS